MSDTLSLVLIVSAALLIGGLAGALLVRKTSSNVQARQALESRCQQLEDQQAQYQYRVREHFEKTDALLTQMAESYREVHNHLVRGAEQLDAGDTVSLRTLPDHKPVLEAGHDSISLEAPPLDYASKSGALKEDYDLEKPAKEQAIPSAPLAS